MMKHFMNVLRAGACAAAGGLAYAPASMAQEVVAGWEGSSGQGYAFVAPAFTLQRGEQISWLLRGTLSYLYYDFPEAGADTRVRSPGQSLAIAMRHAAPNFTLTVAPGYEVRQTRRRSPSGVERTVRERGVTVNGNIFIQATSRTVLSLLGSYGKANDYYWARAGIKQQISGVTEANATAWHVGAELTSQGNDDVKSRQAGGVVEAAFPNAKASLQFRAGYSRRDYPDGSRKSEPYFGLGFYRAF